MAGGRRHTDSDPPEPAALPEPARSRLIERAAQVLGELESAEVPAVLRRVARFEPRRRARLAAAQIAAALETDEGFRGQVADALRHDQPDLLTAVAAGEQPPGADAVELAVAAYLVRPTGWRDLVAAARVDVDKAAVERRETAELARLRGELDTARAETEKAVAKVTAQLADAKAEVRLLRGRVHEERQRSRAAEDRAEAAEAAAQRARLDAEEAAEAAAGQAGEVRKLRARLEQLNRQLESDRRASRAEHSHDLARLAVLVDTLIDAATGLRRELALPADVRRPADAVADRHATGAEGASAVLGAEGPELLDRLLATPQAHLVVDGYNVTKTGWPQLTLQQQRAQLLSGLATLASQFRGEVTCVFDGADVGSRVSAPQMRGVRVVFSPAAATADEVIIELVHAEPVGRRVVVVSSDQEVAQRAVAAGAQPVSSQLLVDRLTGS